MILNILNTYDELNDFTKEELIKMVIALDQVADEAKNTINKLTDCNNKLLGELGYDDLKVSQRLEWKEC